MDTSIEKRQTSINSSTALADRVAENQDFLESGELLLGFGTVLLAFAVASTHVVMGIFLAVPAAILALALLLLGIARAQCSEEAVWKRIAGFLLLLASLGAGIVVGLKACSLFYAVTYQNVRPSAIALPGSGAWVQNIILWFIPAGLAATGLPHWTDWSRSRRMRWCIIVFIFPLTVILAHRVLTALGGALSA